jgi:hypothetical protein
MNADIKMLMEKLRLKDDAERYHALQEILALTEKKVDWFAQYKDELLAKLTDQNSYQRSIGLMLLCNLAKNDQNNEFKAILQALHPLLNDEKFITQRQYIQNVWKIAIVNSIYEKIIITQLAEEFQTCLTKKHHNLLRMDITASLNNIMQANQNEDLKNVMMELINTEMDAKNKKKYLKILRTYP